MHAALLTLVLITSAPIQDRSTPEATVKNFFALLNARDFTKAAKCIAGSKGPADPRQTSKIFSESGMVLKLSNLRSKTTGAKSSVSYQIQASAKGGATRTYSESLTLVRQGTNWLIQRPARGPHNRSTALGDTLANLVVKPDAGGMAQGKEEALRTQCLSNIKQLALGAIMLASDHDDKFAITSTTFRQKVSPYIKNQKVFQCPSGKMVPAYSFNDKLVNVDFNAMKDPSKVVLIYEGRNGKLQFNHAGSAMVAFVDGHARRVVRGGEKALLWSPK